MQAGQLSREIQLREADDMAMYGRQQSGAANARRYESREVEDPGMHGRAMHGNREIPGSPEGTGSGRIGKSKDRS